jgi:hypothetical protein
MIQVLDSQRGGAPEAGMIDFRYTWISNTIDALEQMRG